MTATGQRRNRVPVYTQAQQRKRDASIWTMVQGILAPTQFLVFLVSLVLVLRFLLYGEGQAAAEISVLIKTLVLYLIMVTGSIWEKEVFGKWLFADAFFWEDAVSMVVIALHTFYLVLYLWDIGTPTIQLGFALAAYIFYVANAGQFLYKLRQFRKSRVDEPIPNAAIGEAV